MSTEEKIVYNGKLENSAEYQRILPDVMNEVYTIFAKDGIISTEDSIIFAKEELASGHTSLFGNYEEEIEENTEKIRKAKALLSTNPEAAADLFMMLGSCHRLWSLQKTILKEKYGITWYTPSELNPDVNFD